MTARPPQRLAAGLSLAAGSLDTATGLGLVMLPAAILPLMLVPTPGAEALVFVRFTGAFVAAVGLTYLWGLLEWRRRGSPALLRQVWRLTILFRLAAGSYVLAACLLGWLAPPWLLVSATDGALAVAQFVLLRKGALDGS